MCLFLCIKQRSRSFNITTCTRAYVRACFFMFNHFQPWAYIIWIICNYNNCRSVAGGTRYKRFHNYVEPVRVQKNVVYPILFSYIVVKNAAVSLAYLNGDRHMQQTGLLVNRQSCLLYLFKIFGIQYFIYVILIIE